MSDGAGVSGNGAGTPDGSEQHTGSHHPHLSEEISARSRVIARRSVGSPILFSIIYSSLASAIYFSLGVIAGHALGLTPVVFLIAAGMFTLTAFTYVEGASLHQERGGSTVFARYAFNELVSFIAGWAILLDYVILIAVTTYSATQYLQTFWSPLGHSREALGLSLAFIAMVVLLNIRGFSPRRARRIGIIVAGDLALQAFIVVLGLALFFNPHTLVDPIDLGTSPTWGNLVFALTIAVIAFTSLESASGLAGEVRIGKRGLKRMVGSMTATVVFLYVGIALVAVTALPVVNGQDRTGRQVGERADDRGRDAGPPALAAADAHLPRGRRSPRSRCWRRRTPRCSASRAWPTRSRPTARSPAASAGCTPSAPRRMC